MKIGLLSDSHGHADTTRLAVSVLLDQGAELLIHLGDVGTTQVIDAMIATHPSTAGLVETHVVFGNTDGDRAALGRYARGLGIHVDDPVGRLRVEAGELVFLHGDDSGAMDAAIRDGARYLCHGHTHQARDAHHGATRIINPGALFRARVYSVAILDLERDAG